jgi:hypothetical protein
MTGPGGEREARLRFWWAGHSVVLGLALAFMLAAILGFVAMFPTGSTTMVSGIIENFGLTETDTGSYPVARVRLPDREITVILSRSNTCVIGGPINLQRQQRVWGQTFIVDWTGCGAATDN